MTNLHDIINIVYRREHNPHKTLPRNAVRGIRTATVKGLENAKEFAKSVDVVHAFDSTGKFVKLV